MGRRIDVCFHHSLTRKPPFGDFVPFRRSYSGGYASIVIEEAQTVNNNSVLDATVVSVVADPLQVAQRLNKDHIRFWLANPGFQATDVSLACLKVH